VSAAFSANGAELAIGDSDGAPDDVVSPNMGEGLTFTPSAYAYKIPWRMGSSPCWRDHRRAPPPAQDREERLLGKGLRKPLVLGSGSCVMPAGTALVAGPRVPRGLRRGGSRASACITARSSGRKSREICPNGPGFL
jgi:hypothetical protein